MKTAVIIGATGLIGKLITQKLVCDSRYNKVKVFVRRSIGFHDEKLEENIIDFNQLQHWKQSLTGDELYSALGTTIKKAGNKLAQYKIDYTYQYDIAEAAATNGISKYLLVSSIGANHTSKNFYLSIKGKLDKEVQNLPFKQILIFRPSILSGERDEKRLGEQIGLKVAGVATRIIPPLHKYQPIEAEKVAEIMIKSANENNNDKVRIIESDLIQNI